MPAPRHAAIDRTRGVAMVLMALDHVRDMVGRPYPGGFDFATAGPALFVTRWVTHFCAPTFVFLAGVGASLMTTSGRPRAEVSRFLLGRGAWLLIAELTIINGAWNLNLGPRFVPVLQVIWAIGWSMIVLGGLVWLPRAAIGAIGGTMVLAHNLLDGRQPAPITASPVWLVLHGQGSLTIGGTPVAFVGYPLVPWIGVMAAGYAAGSVFGHPHPGRPAWLVRSGVLGIVMFLALRAGGFYGEPNPWQVHDTITATVIDFLDTTKYPPSLQFLLMTLGPALLLLGVLGRAHGHLVDALGVVGRVPFFFYVAHLYVIHVLALGLGRVQGFPIRDTAVLFVLYPRTFGVGLPGVYAVWVVVLLALYPACRWFAGMKARHTAWWLRYL